MKKIIKVIVLCFTITFFTTGNLSAATKYTYALGSNAQTANNICAGTSNNIIHAFTITESTGTGNTSRGVTGVTVTIGGTWVSADVTNFKLYYTTSNSFATTNLLATITNPATGNQTFTFTNPFNSSTTLYFWITADISASATNNRTLIGNAMASTDITPAGGTNRSGSASASSTKTISTLTTPGAITSNSPQCAGTGITFTKGSCTEGTCYWVSSATGTETTNSANSYTTTTTAGTYNV